MKTFTYVIAPDGCKNWLTPWKKYSITIVDTCKSRHGFYFCDDNGDSRFSTHLSRVHTNNNLWIIPEINQWPEGWTKKQKKECLRKVDIAENRDGYVRRLDEPEQSYEGETSSFSTNDFQGRTQQQVEGSSKIMNICFIALFVLIVIAAILKGCN